MIKMVSISGSLIAFAMVVIAFAGAPKADGETRDIAGWRDGCALQEIALDEGYGVSRKVVRQICPTR